MVKNKKKKSRIRLYRRTTQVAVALAFVLVPWLNTKQINLVHGNFLCFNLAGIPLADPLAVLQIMVKNGYLSQDLIIGALIALGIAFCLGTVFCSWICPYGLLSDLGQTVARKWQGKQRGRAVNRSGFLLKLSVFFLGFAGFLVFSTTPVLNQLSLPAWYSRIFQFIFVQGFLSVAIWVLLLVLAAEVVFRQRFWCRYICPQSVLLILAKQLNPRRLRVGFDPGRCVGAKGDKSPCARSCNLGLDPKRLDHGLETVCTNCGNCITACSGCGKALTYQFKR